MTKTLHVYNLKGDKLAETVEFTGLPKKIKPSLVYQAAIDYLATGRSGTACTKTRSEVRGGGKKPWAQKGTGRARAGSSRSPLFRGGGVSFGPKPRTYGGDLPKGTKRAALKSAILNKTKNFFLVHELDVKHGKTKEVVEMLNNFKVKSALFVDEKMPAKFMRAAQNIPSVKVSNLNGLNVYDLVKYENLFMTTKASKKLMENLK